MKKATTLPVFAAPRGIAIVALLMILFGLAEVVTGFTHEFFGISTTQGSISTYGGAVIGALYAIAGLLILSMKKWAAALAIVCLVADVAGRVALVVGGFFPVDSFRQTFAIVLGTAIALFFAIYIGWRWKAFQ